MQRGARYATKEEIEDLQFQKVLIGRLVNLKAIQSFVEGPESSSFKSL